MSQVSTQTSKSFLHKFSATKELNSFLPAFASGLRSRMELRQFLCKTKQTASESRLILRFGHFPLHRRLAPQCQSPDQSSAKLNKTECTHITQCTHSLHKFTHNRRMKALVQRKHWCQSNNAKICQCIVLDCRCFGSLKPALVMTVKPTSTGRIEASAICSGLDNYNVASNQNNNLLEADSKILSYHSRMRGPHHLCFPARVSILCLVTKDTLTVSSYSESGMA